MAEDFYLGETLPG